MNMKENEEGNWMSGEQEHKGDLFSPYALCALWISYHVLYQWTTEYCPSLNENQEYWSG